MVVAACTRNAPNAIVKFLFSSRHILHSQFVIIIMQTPPWDVSDVPTKKVNLKLSIEKCSLMFLGCSPFGRFVQFSRWHFFSFRWKRTASLCRWLISVKCFSDNAVYDMTVKMQNEIIMWLPFSHCFVDSLVSEIENYTFHAESPNVQSKRK